MTRGTGPGARTRGPRVNPVPRLVRRLFSQEVALANAAQASVRLRHRRREREEAHAFVERATQAPSGRGNYRDR